MHIIFLKAFKNFDKFSYLEIVLYYYSITHFASTYYKLFILSSVVSNIYYVKDRMDGIINDILGFNILFLYVFCVLLISTSTFPVEVCEMFIGKKIKKMLFLMLEEVTCQFVRTLI